MTTLLSSLFVPTKLAESAKLPEYAHPGDAGADLRLNLDPGVKIWPGERFLAPTGVSVAIPAGFVGLICPRSGLAARCGLTVLNAPGVVDSGYRGQVMVSLINHGRGTLVLHHGDRIAQLLIMPVARAEFTAWTNDTTSRGEGGHGSTGA